MFRLHNTLGIHRTITHSYQCNVPQGHCTATVSGKGNARGEERPRRI